MGVNNNSNTFGLFDSCLIVNLHTIFAVSLPTDLNTLAVADLPIG